MFQATEAPSIVEGDISPEEARCVSVWRRGGGREREREEEKTGRRREEGGGGREEGGGGLMCMLDGGRDRVSESS
jgi:hypothetical protein